MSAKYVVVPVEPTKEMLLTLQRADEIDNYRAKGQYIDLITEAPNTGMVAVSRYDLAILLSLETGSDEFNDAHLRITEALKNG